jgi:hypothetical protein
MCAYACAYAHPYSYAYSYAYAHHLGQGRCYALGMTITNHNQAHHNRINHNQPQDNAPQHWDDLPEEMKALVAKKDYLRLIARIRLFMQDYGYAPLVREIAEATSYSQTKVDFMLYVLERLNVITRTPHIARSIVIHDMTPIM